jgi:hypothetical protein
MTNPILGPLADEITQTRGVIASAVTLINGFAARLDAAVQTALANGATELELAPFTELEAALETDRNALAAAVAANSEPGPTPESAARRR